MQPRCDAVLTSKSSSNTHRCILWPHDVDVAHKCACGKGWRAKESYANVTAAVKK